MNKLTIQLATTSIGNAVAVAVNYMNKSGAFAEKLTFESNGSNIAVKASNDIQTISINVVILNKEEINFSPFTVNGKKLLTVLKTVSSDEVKFDLTEGNITIKHGRRRAKIEITAEPQPFAKKDETIESFVITNEFVSALRTAEHSTPSDHSKNQLNGVYLHNKNGKLAIISTDADRLTIQENNTSINGKYIIPKDGVKTLIKYCQAGETILFGNTSITVVNQFIEYTCKIIAGDYVAYEGILPKSVESEITLSKNLLTTVVKGASLFENNVILDLKDNKIIANDELDSCSAEEEIITNGSSMKFGISSKYLLEFLSSVSSENITIGFNEPGLPLIFKIDDSQYEIIMPILKDEE